jgi:hypothetical protein
VVRRLRCRGPSGDGDVGLRKVVALEQERLAAGAGERKGETVAEVEARRMAAVFAEIAIGRAGDLGLLAVDRLDDDAGARDQIVEASRQQWVAVGVDDDRRLEIIAADVRLS